VAFDLIIFDCDGVLVDSEVISCRAHADALTRHGYPITPEQVLRRFLGVSDREARLMIENETGRDLPDDFEAQVKAATLQFYEDLKPIAHVAEAVRAIDLPRCVALQRQGLLLEPGRRSRCAQQAGCKESENDKSPKSSDPRHSD